MPLTPLQEVQGAVLRDCPPLVPRAIPLEEALGCVTAAPLEAEELVPPFDNTAMDGFAVRAADTEGAPVELKVVGTLAAGAAPDVEVGPGQAVRIMTGAPIPPGADAVVMVERTRTDGDVVVIEQRAGAGDHIRRAGDDLHPGQVVVEPFTVLGPGHLGVLASLGYRRVPVLPGPASACSPPATSWSRVPSRCAPARSGTRTGRPCSPSSASPASPPSTSGWWETTRPPSPRPWSTG